MSTVTLWLEIREHREGAALLGSTKALLTKEMETGFLPRKDDPIYLLRSEDPDDTEWEVAQEVKRVYWEGDGKVNVTLRPIFYDPPQRWQESNGWQYESAWYPERDGADLIERLLASGWERYGA